MKPWLQIFENIGRLSAPNFAQRVTLADSAFEALMYKGDVSNSISFLLFSCLSN